VPPLPFKPAANRLLAALPPRDQRRLLAGSERVELAMAQELYAPGARLTHAYFPLTAIISRIMEVDAGDYVEVGLIGDEGMFGVPLALGVHTSPVRAVVQGAGSALRMEAARFCDELARMPALQREVQRYVYVYLTQLSQSAGCTRFHVVEARLARWLLMTQDRAGSASFHITQEFLAFMLGVRRVGVTKAASALQERGFIRYRRGDITVIDRRGLKTAACGCYKADRRTYDQYLGLPRPARAAAVPPPAAPSRPDDAARFTSNHAATCRIQRKSQ
jgi:CRP-like cAMP-binding protein